VRAIPEQRYVDALVGEIVAAAADTTWRGRPVATVFFGGGTPSLFTPASFERIMRALDDAFGLLPAAEISIEANPEDVAPAALDHLRALRATGLNRLSLGAQSFDARVLATLGRMHTAADVERGVAQARAAGFDNVSCDLIFAVPGQSPEGWRTDLERMLALGAEHVSTYGLTYEEGTPLTAMRSSGRVNPVGENDERRMYEAADRRADGSGLPALRDLQLRAAGFRVASQPRVLGMERLPRSRRGSARLRAPRGPPARPTPPGACMRRTPAPQKRRGDRGTRT
jgi:oxygen-independent coproporphyrinogen-3 oxidase